MTEHAPLPGFVAQPDQPLIGIVVREGNRDVVHYVVDEGALDRSADESIARALSLAGAWSDLDWDEAEEEFDRIRHESQPTPPITEL